MIKYMIYDKRNLYKYFAEVKSNKGAPVMRVHIDKDDGTKRPLGIPNVRGRIV
ncbi:MAG: hypothetical protein RR894_10015 [Terrisporobacter sp.]